MLIGGFWIPPSYLDGMKAGDVFTPENLRSVRPSCGLHTKYYEELLGKRITRDAKLGTPMSWDLVDFSE